MREVSKTVGESVLEQLASEVFEDQKRATDWMDRPNVALGGATPRAVSHTEAGCQRAKRVLYAIEHGGVV